MPGRRSRNELKDVVGTWKAVRTFRFCPLREINPVGGLLAMELTPNTLYAAKPFFAILDADHPPQHAIPENSTQPRWYTLSKPHTPKLIRAIEKPLVLRNINLQTVEISCPPRVTFCGPQFVLLTAFCSWSRRLSQGHLISLAG